MVNLDLDNNSELDTIYLKNGNNDILINYNPETNLPKYLLSSKGEALTFFFSNDLTTVDIIQETESGEMTFFSSDIDPEDDKNNTTNKIVSILKVLKKE